MNFKKSKYTNTRKNMFFEEYPLENWWIPLIICSRLRMQNDFESGQRSLSLFVVDSIKSEWIFASHDAGIVNFKGLSNHSGSQQCPMSWFEMSCRFSREEWVDWSEKRIVRQKRNSSVGEQRNGGVTHLPQERINRRGWERLCKKKKGWKREQDEVRKSVREIQYKKKEKGESEEEKKLRKNYFKKTKKRKKRKLNS